MVAQLYDTGQPSSSRGESSGLAQDLIVEPLAAALFLFEHPQRACPAGVFHIKCYLS